MKKIIGVIACGLFLNAAAASSQVTDKEKVQMEKRIEKLIKKMTLEEKVGLLHGNSKFYVAGVERLGIPEWSLSDGPHGVRAEINRHDWAYAGWTNDSASYFPTCFSLFSCLSTLGFFCFCSREAEYSLNAAVMASPSLALKNTRYRGGVWDGSFVMA